MTKCEKLIIISWHIFFVIWRQHMTWWTAQLRCYLHEQLEILNPQGNSDENNFWLRFLHYFLCHIDILPTHITVPHWSTIVQQNMSFIPTKSNQLFRSPDCDFGVRVNLESYEKAREGNKRQVEGKGGRRPRIVSPASQPRNVLNVQRYACRMRRCSQSSR